MTTSPGRTPASDVEPYRVRLSDPGEIAAAVPHLLGFRPAESVVLIGLGGPSGGRLELTVRVDIPPAEDAAALARVLVRSVHTDLPGAVVAVLVSEAPDDHAGAGSGPDLPHRALLHEVTQALARDGIPLRAALLVRAGRWWSYDCPDACCRPGSGTALPGGVTELEAASVATGAVVADSRDDLVRRLEGSADRSRTRDACLRQARERWAMAAERGPQAVADDAWAAVRDAVAACQPGAAAPVTLLTDDLVARVVWGLRDTSLRDRALELALGADPSAAEALWTECTRRAPVPLDAAPATLLAVSAWLRGDGAMANVALEHALDSDPDYALAGLLAHALAACMRPAELRRLIAGTTGPHPAG